MKEEGIDFLRRCGPALRIAVLGDVMTDRYISGDVSRISPEAPVPVNLVTAERAVLGGAANTAANLAKLGCSVFACGMRGEDENGRMLASLFEKSGIDSAGILATPGYRTITKIRVLGARQQMIRLDFETKRDLTDEECDRVLAWLDALHAEGLSAVVLSDYGKGFITEKLARAVISRAHKWDIPVLIDPKGADWRKYTGAFAVTPNLKELSEACGETIPNTDEAVARAGALLREKFHLKYLYVTRSEKGITSIGAKEIIHCPARARDVFDVSGAGDTVMAVLTAAAACGKDTETALALANTAGGIAVSRVGTYPVSHAELAEAWDETETRLSRDYAPTSWEDAAKKIKNWQARGETVVFTNGCFDILHRGHIAYLSQAAALGDHLVIGLNSDASVRRLKGNTRPVNGEIDRAYLLAALRFTDDVVIFGEDTPAKLLETLRPDILVKGGDYTVETVIGKEFVREVRILPFVEGYSTTETIAKIKK